MESIQLNESKDRPLDLETRPGGRVLFALLTVCSAVFLILIGNQTEPGFEGGDWWNEPLNAPSLALVLIFVTSLLATIFAAPNLPNGQIGDVGVAVILSVVFLAAIWMIPIVGYGLSVLLFSAVAGWIARFRGRKLVWISLGMTALMLITFRYALGLWFPRAELFKLTPWLETAGSYL